MVDGKGGRLGGYLSMMGEEVKEVRGKKRCWGIPTRARR